MENNLAFLPVLVYFVVGLILLVISLSLISIALDVRAIRLMQERQLGKKQELPIPIKVGKGHTLQFVAGEGLQFSSRKRP